MASIDDDDIDKNFGSHPTDQERKFNNVLSDIRKTYKEACEEYATSMQHKWNSLVKQYIILIKMLVENHKPNKFNEKENTDIIVKDLSKFTDMLNDEVEYKCTECIKEVFYKDFYDLTKPPLLPENAYLFKKLLHSHLYISRRLACDKNTERNGILISSYDGKKLKFWILDRQEFSIGDMTEKVVKKLCDTNRKSDFSMDDCEN